jgi:ElaB/YqjD/DUF883 family membrane-anchored ribosome-binding protein
VTRERDNDVRLAEGDAAQAELRTDAGDATEQMTEEEAAEAAEIRADIEETRAEMGGTLQELGDRLDPGTLMNQAKENVREATIGRVEETAKGMTDMVMDTIKRNPIPAALAGAGLALLWVNRSDGNQAGGNGHRSGPYYGTTSSFGQRQSYSRPEEGIGERVGSAVAGAGDTVRGAVGQAGQTAGEIGENVGQVAGQLGENVGQAAGQVGGQLDRFMRANPLAMGAIAAGAGAVIGALLPETPQERELMGDASRQVGAAVRETVDQAADKAEQAMDRTEERVTSNA